MNCQLRDITVTARDGRVSHLDQVYIRGSHVRYFIVPDMLRYAEQMNGQSRGTDRSQERSNVQDERSEGSWCWFGPW